MVYDSSEQSEQWHKRRFWIILQSPVSVVDHSLPNRQHRM